jgi:hypothetical protein
LHLYFRGASCQSPSWPKGATGETVFGEAEIEADQDGTDVIAIDSPAQDVSNIPRLFEVQANFPMRSDIQEFKSFYVAVEEETFTQRFVKSRMKKHFHSYYYLAHTFYTVMSKELFLAILW